jgi:hypothetical protein
LKFRIRLGPQYPHPITPIPIIFGSLSLDE